MICPNCKCEYIKGVTECADCGVPLVDALEARQPGFSENAPIVAVWRGTDPAEHERVEEALTSAGIPFTAPDTKSAFSFLATDPTMEVWVSEADIPRAGKILEELDDRAHPDEISPEDAASLALPETADQEEEQQIEPPPKLPEFWYEDGPVAEVWSGDDGEFSDALEVCLREVGIVSHKFSEGGRSRLVVSPQQESRAKEVVREVINATPPE